MSSDFGEPIRSYSVPVIFFIGLRFAPSIVISSRETYFMYSIMLAFYEFYFGIFNSGSRDSTYFSSSTGTSTGVILLVLFSSRGFAYDFYALFY